jgi:hypothetical protein
MLNDRRTQRQLAAQILAAAPSLDEAADVVDVEQRVGVEIDDDRHAVADSVDEAALDRSVVLGRERDFDRSSFRGAVRCASSLAAKL